MLVMILFAMLRRYLALDKGEIILLKWKDIKPTKYTLLHKICIYRCLNSSEQIIYYTEKGPVEAAREPFLPPTLYAYLVQWKNRLIEIKGVQAVDSYMPVFPASVFYSSVTDNRFLTHKQANIIETEIDTLCGLNKTELMVHLRDKKIKDVNLNNYKGDIYKTNFEFQALRYGLEPGAIDSILGRKSKYTYARHYVNYRDEYIQEMIAMAIERMIAEDSSSYKTAYFSEGKFLPSTSDMMYTAGKRTVKQFIISLNEETTLTITSSNSYGTNVTIIITRKEI